MNKSICLHKFPEYYNNIFIQMYRITNNKLDPHEEVKGEVARRSFLCMLHLLQPLCYTSNVAAYSLPASNPHQPPCHDALRSSRNPSMTATALLMQ
jgi:hypothetical protein